MEPITSMHRAWSQRQHSPLPSQQQHQEEQQHPPVSPHPHQPAYLTKAGTNSHHTPLFIPEILEPILSLLDQKSLLASRLVCSTWAAIARPCLSLESIWRDCSLSEAKIVCLERLARTDILVVQYHPKNTSTIPSSTVGTEKDKDKDRENILFGDLSPPLATLQRTARVKKLVLKDAYDFHTRLEVFLDVFPTLSTLVLDGLIKGPLRIDILLASCPSLKTLSVEYVLSDHVLWGPPPSPRFIVTQQQQQQPLSDFLTEYINQPFAPPPLQRGYGLQTLILRHAMSSQSVIQSVLQALPSLLSLEIRFLKISSSHPVNLPIFHRPTFFRYLSGSCPNLQHLHFSIFQRVLLVSDSTAMCEALPTLTGLGFPCQDLESHRQSIGIGIDETDAGGVGLDTPRLGVLEFYVNHLTRLELLAYRYLQEDSLISNLHAFLTEAVHLRHLVAPKVNYWMEFLEMKDVQPSNGAGAPTVRTTADGQHHYQYQHPATSIMSAAASSANNSQWSTSKTKTWGWACRNLETLHLGFKAKETYTPNSQSDSRPRKHDITEESRVLFGFIARNCPRLKDLHIRKYSLDLSLEGGLCLVTQLRELERLVIWSQTKGFRLREKDVDWIGYNGVDDVFVAGGVSEQQLGMPAVGETAGPAAVTPMTSTSTSQSTITIATGTGTGTKSINASTVPPPTTPAVTVAVHTATSRTNNSTTSSTPTINTINPNTGSTNKGSKKRIKKIFRGLSSSSSSPSSIPPKTRPQQHALVIQKRPTEFYTNMPSKVMAVFKTDDDWFANMTSTKSAIGWTNLVVATTVSSTGSLSSPSPLQEEQQAAPLFAKKDQSAYRCWPHLRTMVWAIDPVNVFHDERASKVFSKLRPDIEFKVQQYLEW